MELKNIKDLELFLNDNELFEKLGVDIVGVFGSFARGEAGEDIDLLFENAHDKEKIVAMKEYLEKTIGKKIDIVFDEFANPIILHRAKKDLKYVKKYQQ